MYASTPPYSRQSKSPEEWHRGILTAAAQTPASHRRAFRVLLRIIASAAMRARSFHQLAAAMAAESAHPFEKLYATDT